MFRVLMYVLFCHQNSFLSKKDKKDVNLTLSTTSISLTIRMTA
jgi:hypothetical protein